MTKWSSLVGLKSMLAVLTLLPLLVLIWFEADAAIDRQHDLSEVAALNQLAKFSAGTGNLVHVLQIERGATAVYLSTQSDEFLPQLEDRRNDTDIQLTNFIDLVEDELANLPIEVQQAAKMALDALVELEPMRVEVNALSIDTAKAMNYFTSTNDRLLGIVKSTGTITADADLAKQVISLTGLLEAKERTGIERALLANVFGIDQFAPSELVHVVGLIAARDSFLAGFAASATPEMLEQFEQNQSMPVVATIAELERRAIDNGVSDFDIDSDVWFDTMTERINLLKELEDAQVAEITERASYLTSEANRDLGRAILSVLAVAALTSILMTVVARRIIRQLNILSAQAERIADGDLQVSELNLPGGDTVAHLGSSFDRMSRTLHLIRDQLTAVGNRNLEADSLSVSIPGELGTVVESLIAATRERVELETREKLASARTETLLQEVTSKAEELHITAQELQRTRDRFEGLLQNAFEAILVADLEGNISYLSSPFETVFGRPASDYLGYPITKMSESTHPDDKESAQSQYETALRDPDNPAPVEVRFQHGDGTWHWIQLMARDRRHDESIAGIIFNARDITEQKTTSLQLELHANEDGLTGLANRRLLMTRLEHALSRTRRSGGNVALLFMDLDGFKEINDSMGHGVGDELLSVVGERLRSLTRGSDTAARLGGDEFLVLAEGIKDVQEAILLGTRLVEKIREPVTINGEILCVTTSMGIAISVDGSDDSESLLKKADNAMYQAKQTGRNGLEIHGHDLELLSKQQHSHGATE